MPILFEFKKGGGVIVKPVGYEGITCHEATRPYTDSMQGKKKVVETTDTGVVAVQNQSRQQKAGQ